jgi:hypothetical protein
VLHLVAPFGEIYSSNNVSSSSSSSSSSSFRVPRLNAAEQRTLRFIYYFVKFNSQHQQLLNDDDKLMKQMQNSLSYNADVLASTLPYCIGFHKIYVHVLQLSHIAKEEIIPIINGSIVGLCHINVPEKNKCIDNSSSSSDSNGNSARGSSASGSSASGSSASGSSDSNNSSSTLSWSRYCSND